VQLVLQTFALIPPKAKAFRHRTFAPPSQFSSLAFTPLPGTPVPDRFASPDRPRSFAESSKNTLNARPCAKFCIRLRLLSRATTKKDLPMPTGTAKNRRAAHERHAAKSHAENSFGGSAYLSSRLGKVADCTLSTSIHRSSWRSNCFTIKCLDPGVFVAVDTHSTGAKRAPALDEETFQRLLAAAFVVQQHNDGLLVPQKAAPSFRKPEAPTAPALKDFKQARLAPKAELVSSVCRGCGHIFSESESFCGVCGTARHLQNADLQSKWASLWYMQQGTRFAEETAAEAEDNKGTQETKSSPILFKRAVPSSAELAPSHLPEPELATRPEAAPGPLPAALQEVLRHLEAEGAASATSLKPESAVPFEHNKIEELKKTESSGSSLEISLSAAKPLPDSLDFHHEAIEASLPELPTVESSKITSAASSPEILPRTGSVWSSAARARAWLESLKKQPPNRVWLSAHRANLYLAVSVVLLLIALFSWGSSPSAVVPGSNQPQLTAFEQLLVNLGVAEAPAIPVYPGNPNAEVWEDVHTGLYYCAGADSFGKTPGGKLAHQRDAELDAFEPALRKPCE
jgi:hypothetical protein